MFKILTLPALALSLALASSQVANAQVNDWYLGGSIGYNQTLDQTSEAGNEFIDTEFDAGITTSSIVGFHLADTLRIEGEFSWRRNDGDSLSLNGIDQGFTAKGAESYNLLANAFYDFHNSSSVTPYIGAGAGIGFLNNEFRYGLVEFEDKDTAFVYQGIIGASLPITDRITGFVDARYFAATGVDFERVSPAGRSSFDSEYENFSVSVGYRFKL